MNKSKHGDGEVRLLLQTPRKILSIKPHRTCPHPPQFRLGYYLQCNVQHVTHDGAFHLIKACYELKSDIIKYSFMSLDVA